MSITPWGIVAFIVILGVMVLFHEFGHFVLAKRAGIRVEEFGVGYPPRLFGVRRGETVYSVNLVPLGGFVRMLGEEDPTHEDSFARASKLWRTAVLVAGPVMNLLLAVLLFAASFMAGWPTPVATEVMIANVLPDSPAETAGLRAGDVILGIDGRAIANMDDVRTAARANAGRDMTLDLQRDGGRVAVKVQPRPSGPGQGTLGISLNERATKMAHVSYPLSTALVKGAAQTAEVVAITFYVPVLALRGHLPAEAARPVGPVGIFDAVSQATEQTVARSWWFPLLSTAGLLSAGLGIANLLPIPGLDGGRLLFVALEAIRGRRIKPEREGMIHLVGIAFLLSLVVIVSYFDILAPMARIDWGP